jgi:hypothetical protein
LCGCAAFKPADEGARLRSAIAAASQQIQSCYGRLGADPKYAPLRQRLAIIGRLVPTDDQLRDGDQITPQMIQLGLDWYSENQACDRATVETYGRVDPELGATAAGWVAEITDIVQSVLRDRPTYATINARVKRLGERERADVRRYYANLDARIRRQQAEERAAEERKSEESGRRFRAAIGTIGEVLANTLVIAVQVLAIRQAALAQAQVQYVRSVPAYQPVRITTTNCQFLGDMLQCNQYGQ